MHIVRVSERQFHALMLPALRYRQALCLRNLEMRVRELCACYSSNDIEIVAPPLRADQPWSTSDRIDQMMRLVNPQLRDRAMVVVFWKGMSQSLLRRIEQVEVF